MEDFGYVRDENKKDLASLSKKIFLSCATLFSISCFIYITIHAYYYVYGEKNSEVETIKSPEGPIKVVEEDELAIRGEEPKINDSIYEDIFGTNKESLAKMAPKIRISPEPAIPPKKMAAELGESVPNLKESDATKETQVLAKKPQQPIIVYSDKPKENEGAKDLLTKGNVAAKAEVKNTAKNVSDQNLDKPKAAKRRFVRIQVAALTSKKSAEEYWQKISNSNSRLFSNLKSFTGEVNLGKKGIFYRLQIGNFSDQIAAEDFCKRYTSQLQKSKADCIVVE